MLILVIRRPPEGRGRPAGDSGSVANCIDTIWPKLPLFGGFLGCANKVPWGSFRLKNTTRKATIKDGLREALALGRRPL